MNRQPVSNRQHGVALILSLLLLLIMTLIGVAAMSSTIMQERMAGNARVQAMVFEGASSGVSSAIEFMRDEDNWSEVPDPKLCGIVGEGKGWGPTQWTEVERNGPLAIEQRMYCIEHPTDPNLLPSQLFVLSRGSMVGDNGSTAMREIEIRLNEAKPGDPTCAICAVGEIDDVGAATSNSLKVDGSCGPAITTSSQEGALTFLDALKDDRIGNYQGGIVSGDIGNPWTDPELLAEFVYWTKLGLTPGIVSGNSYSGQYFAGSNYNITGSQTFGTTDSPQITYFDGDVNMGGNVSGAGMLIVNGDLGWSGTPAFQGLILILGGDIEVGGGGGGGNPAGTIIATNLDADHGDGNPDSPIPDFSTADFAEDGITFQWNGGGNEAFTYDCGLLEEYRDALLVDQHFPANEMWDVRCDCYGIGPDTPEVVISSWRENIGWRDEFFGSDDS